MIEIMVGATVYTASSVRQIVNYFNPDNREYRFVGVVFDSNLERLEELFRSNSSYAHYDINCYFFHDHANRVANRSLLRKELNVISELIESKTTIGLLYRVSPSKKTLHRKKMVKIKPSPEVVEID